MSETSAPPAVTATQEQQQQHPHQMLPQVAMSTSGASNTSNGSSRRAAASSAASSSHSASRVTPATTLSARNTVTIHQQQPPQQQALPPPPPPPPLLETLPSAETQRHIAEARAAVVASIGNMLDTELQGRAAVLHENAGALDKQERDVLAATEALRREREKLAREADTAARRLKEVGNVQNWAEVLERGFLVLEETVRLANRPGDGNSDGYGSWSGSGSRSGSVCSCSDCGRTLDGALPGEEMDVDVGGGGGEEERVAGKGKGKEVEVAMDGLEVMSETSRSLFDGESSTANDTGKAKNSETGSLSTTC